VHVWPVRDNIYMIVGAGGNITVQTGKDGVLVVDSGLANMSDKVLAAIRSISKAPIRYLVNTHYHPDHVGGNEAIPRPVRRFRAVTWRSIWALTLPRARR